MALTKEQKEAIRITKNAAMREWRAKNRDKIKEYNERYWLKKAGLLDSTSSTENQSVTNNISVTKTVTDNAGVTLEQEILQLKESEPNITNREIARRLNINAMKVGRVLKKINEPKTNNAITNKNPSLFDG